MELLDEFSAIAVGVSGAVAALATALTMPWAIRLAFRVGAVDHPGGRREQLHSVPRLGGVAIAVGIVASVATSLWFFFDLTSLEGRQLSAIVAGATMLFVLGAIDDRRGLSVPVKLAVQLTAATLVVLAGLRFEVVGLPFFGVLELGELSPVLSILWIVGVTNAINLIDGLDGLAGGVVVIIATTFSIYGVINGLTLSVALTAALSGACIGFLRQNWSPARVFMGDSGSLMLGFLLAAISVHSSLKTSATVAILVPVLALGVPVLDTLLVMGRRFARHPASHPFKRLLRVFRADRNHVHHLMLFFRATDARIVLTIYALVLASCIFSLTVAMSNSALLGVALVLVELLALIGIRFFALRRRRKVTRTTAAEPAQLQLWS